MMSREVEPGVSRERLIDIEASILTAWDEAEFTKAGQMVGDVIAANSLRLLGPDATDGEICAMAERRADAMRDRVASVPGLYAWPSGAVLKWCSTQAIEFQGRALKRQPGAKPEQIKRGAINRLTCKTWWTRALRRAVTDQREAAGRDAGRVCAMREQYITNETMRRRMNQDEKNRAMLEATELENEDGQVFTLAQLSEVSVSNPSIRRGELMTRIRGCEEWAEAQGMRGVFLTLTTPSRFHAVHRHGGLNEKWVQGGKATPKDGQRWLCKQWVSARAALQRRGLGVFGFRVAEPHHDGTPHWHGLFWCKPGELWRVVRVVKRQWLKDEGQEAGARQHRVKAMAMVGGAASGYIAKYIAKGIDDAGSVGASGHDDEIDGRMVRMDQSDMFGGGAARVQAWARAHGIRQFQAVGQPPVTVWRELRRIKEAQAFEASERISAMWSAAQRDGIVRANWALYMLRQGGAFCGRNYRVAVDTEVREVQGRYEDADKAKPVGVLDRIERARAYSDRKEWKPRGTWTRGLGVSSRGTADDKRVRGLALPSAVHPWTRVNNCTDQPKQKPRTVFLLDWKEFYTPEMVGEIQARTEANKRETGQASQAHRLRSRQVVTQREKYANQ